MIGQDSQNEDTKVAQLLGSLPSVEPPADFDFRVKARIANGEKPAERGARLIPLVGLAAPAVLAVAVGGYWFMQEPVAPSVDSAKAAVTQEAPAPGPAQAFAPPQPAAAGEHASANVAPARTARTGVPTQREGRESTEGGGSVDSGVSEVKPKFPRGINPNPVVVHKPRDMQNPAGIPARDILTSLGADVEFAGNSYRVTRVREASVAERSGLKAGDVVEAINERKVERNTAFTGSVSGRSIRVNRDGRSVEINLTKP
jgi:membrane-associated protease RseP (regulator of RpoE activity)